ncbi:MAG: hypothetical protein RRY36_04355 [Bacteroidaceae bacterium]
MKIESRKESIAMLQYQVRRYKAMGNGATCQTLNARIQKLMAKQMHA